LDENDVKHPTLKPVDLMRYLVRLVTPKNGIVLDPFMGAGTTGVASLLEEFKFVGIELDEKYFESGQRRINNYQEFRDLKKKKTKKSNLDKTPLQK
jgi:site-specific DNA-methyltransferase (adenine-specific)